MKLNLRFAVIELNFNVRKKHKRVKQCHSCSHRKEHMFIHDTCDIDNYLIKGHLIDGYLVCKHYEKVIE